MHHDYHSTQNRVVINQKNCLSQGSFEGKFQRKKKPYYLKWDYLKEMKRRNFLGRKKGQKSRPSLWKSQQPFSQLSLSSSFLFSSHSHNTYKPTLYNLEKSPNQLSGTSLNLICSTNCSQMPQSRINYSPFYIPVHTVFSYIHTYIHM